CLLVSDDPLSSRLPGASEAWHHPCSDVRRTPRGLAGVMVRAGGARPGARRETTMGGATRFARWTFGSLAIVLALTGCAGRSWQVWKPPPREAPTTPPQGAPTENTTPAPANPSVPTSHPAPAAESTT